VTRRGRGQASVEFALAITILVSVMVGLFDIGRAAFSSNTISHSAREAARRAAVEASWVGVSPCMAPTCPATSAVLKAHVVAAANQVAGVGTITPAQVKLHCSETPPPNNNSWSGNNCASSNATGNVVTVRVSYTFVPLIQLFDIQIATQTSMVIG
jgi:Flp pilus assembly protein TadG